MPPDALSESAADDATAGGRSSPRVGIAIVSWNVRDLVLRCLATVFASHGVTPDVVLVDNASADGTVEAVRAAFPSVRVLPNADNRGFTAANNQAFRLLGVLDANILDANVDATEADSTELDDDAAPAATREGTAPPAYTMLLNPDTELPPSALATLVAALDADAALGAVGPRLRYADGSLQPSRYRDPTPLTCLCDSTPLAWHWPTNPVVRRYHLADAPDDRAQDVDWLNGAALVVRSDALRAVGGLDEGFFMYSEEADLCRRLRALGRRVRFEPAAEIVHHEGRSSGQVVAARHVRFHRSRLRYCLKYDGRAAALIVRAGLSVEFALEILVEGLKWMLRNKPELRAARMKAYWAVMHSV